LEEEIAAVTPARRRFRVYPRYQAGEHARVFAEASFEAAAIAFIDDYAPAHDAGGEIAVHVLDLDSGLEHCFRIDLETCATEPCAE
jgi:hypothetical protein